MMSAPAVLRMPVGFEAPDISEHEATYPWAVNTPEASPRMWTIEPKLDMLAPGQPIVSPDVFRAVCAPVYEQMCWHAASNADMLRSMGGVVSRQSTEMLCEPYFEQMVTALQQALQHTPTQQEPLNMQNMKHTMGPVPLVGHWDDASTDAGEACAFASLLSSPSSDCDEARNVWNEDSEPASDTEKSIMVCRHWKSKGWCRMESKCKFLHLEHKRGVSAANAHSGSATKVDGLNGNAESATSAISAGRHKKRGGKNRSNRDQQAQIGSSEQTVPGAEFQGYVVTACRMKAISRARVRWGGCSAVTACRMNTMTFDPPEVA